MVLTHSCVLTHFAPTVPSHIAMGKLHRVNRAGTALHTLVPPLLHWVQKTHCSMFYPNRPDLIENKSTQNNYLEKVSCCKCKNIYNMRHFPGGHLTETAHFAVVRRHNARQGGKICSWRSWTASNFSNHLQVSWIVFKIKPKIGRWWAATVSWTQGTTSIYQRLFSYMSTLVLRILHYFFLDSSYCLGKKCFTLLCSSWHHYYQVCILFC